MSNPLFQKLYQWEDIAPDKIYLTQPYDGGQCITYTWKEALEQVRRMAAYLHSLGLPEGSRIAMFSKNCSHFILADLAIWMAGHVSVALYPTVGEETAHYALTHSEAALVFVGKLDEGPWQEIQKGIPADLPKISFPPHISPPNDFLQWDDLVAQHEPMPGHPMPDKHKLASIAYTSGSTGQPKGVMHSFHSMLASSGRMDAYFSISPDDRMLSYLPLAHVFERLTVEVASIWYGFALFFAEAVDTFQADLARARPTFFVSVPRLWLLFQQGVFKKMPPQRLNWMLKVPILSRIIKKKILQGLGLDQVRIAVSGSAPIPPELLKWYNDIGLELLEGYGMSENFAYSHLSRPGMVKVGTVGPPCEGVQQRISEEGEILVKSPCDMLGYYKMEALTKQSYTEDGFLKTGDRGEIDQFGRLRITGRVKELFKTSKGKYVAPAPIENLINRSQYVEQSCVTGSGQPKAHAIVLLAESYREQLSDDKAKATLEEKLKELLQGINAKVEKHEQLQFLAVIKEPWAIENGFLTPTMKIKRHAIDTAYHPLSDAWYKANEPIVWES